MEKEKMMVGEVAIGYLLVNLVEKNVITGDEAKDIIAKSINLFLQLSNLRILVRHF
jgi:hypothetical protein